MERARYFLISLCRGMASLRPVCGLLQWNGCRLHATARSPVPEDDRAKPGVSCQQQFRGFRLWIEPENFRPFGFQNERNGFPQIAETFFLRLALPIRAGNFETSRPETAFVRFATVNNCCELFHLITCNLFGRRGKYFFFTSPAESAVRVSSEWLSVM